MTADAHGRTLRRWVRRQRGIALALLVVGAVLLVAGLGFAYEGWYLSERGVRTPARIVAVDTVECDEGCTTDFTAVFTTGTGEAVRSDFYTDGRHRVGERITVVYDARAPEAFHDVAGDVEWAIWFGGICVLLSLPLLVPGARRLGRSRRFAAEVRQATVKGPSQFMRARSVGDTVVLSTGFDPDGPTLRVRVLNPVDMQVLGPGLSTVEVLGHPAPGGIVAIRAGGVVLLPSGPAAAGDEMDAAREVQALPTEPLDVTPLVPPSGRVVFRPLFAWVASAAHAVLAGMVLGGAAWQFLPGEPVAAPVAIGGLAALVGLLRAPRIGLVADDSGVTIRNLFTTRHLAWPDVEAIVSVEETDGEGGVVHVLGIVGRRSDEVLSATVTRSSRTSRRQRRALVESLAGLAARERVRIAISPDYLIAG